MSQDNSGNGLALAIFLGIFTLVCPMAKAGEISGTVIDETTEEPLSGVFIYVLTVDQRTVASASTDENGAYTATDIPEGTYYVQADAQGYLDELYDDIACTMDFCEPITSTPISVSNASITTGIDFALRRLGGLSGTVTDSRTGEPLAFIEIEVISETAYGSIGTTDANGHFVIHNLEPQRHYVAARSPDHLDELYDNIPCPGSFLFECDPFQGQSIPVNLEEITEGIDFALDPFTFFSGTVTDENTGEPLAGLSISVVDGTGLDVGYATTDIFGNYQVDVRSGTYYAAAIDGTSFYISEHYGGDVCGTARICIAGPMLGDPIVVDDSVEGIDFSLQVGGMITGTVTESATGAIIPFGSVEITSTEGVYTQLASVDANGEYVAQGLDGDYYVRFYSIGAYQDEVYDDVPCDTEPCDVTRGAVVSVPAGSTVPGIDFAVEELTNCTPTATNLCLNANRFHIEAIWEDVEGNMGMGQAVKLTNDTGYFWFFGSDNVEVVIKVLDACRIADRYWVFASGLTDLKVRLRVIDTETGDDQNYTNPLSTAFLPIIDQQNFAGCSSP